MSPDGEPVRDAVRQICVVCGVPAELCHCDTVASESDPRHASATRAATAHAERKTVGFVLISASPDAPGDILERLRALPEISEIHPIFDGNDYIAKVEAEDFKMLAQIVTDKIRTLPGIRSAGETSSDKSAKEALHDIYVRELVRRMREDRVPAHPAQLRDVGASLRDLLTHLDVFRFTRKRGRRPPRGPAPVSAPG